MFINKIQIIAVRERRELKKTFRAFVDIKSDELPLALLMFGYFFLVITTFWILKPIKKGSKVKVSWSFKRGKRLQTADALRR